MPVTAVGRLLVPSLGSSMTREESLLIGVGWMPSAPMPTPLYPFAMKTLLCRKGAPESSGVSGLPATSPLGVMLIGGSGICDGAGKLPS